MELDDEDYERLSEIRSLPRDTIVSAIDWWNVEAPESFKRFIIVSAYYELLAQQSEYAEKALEQWENDVF